MEKELGKILFQVCELMIDALRADAPDDKEHVIREINDLMQVINDKTSP